jgi:hypothetical protein
VEDTPAYSIIVYGCVKFLLKGNRALTFEYCTGFELYNRGSPGRFIAMHVGEILHPV